MTRCRIVASVVTLLAALALASAPRLGVAVEPPNDRLHRLTDGSLTVTTAVPSAAETRAIFGLDLYAKGIQPVWVKLENNSDETLILTPMGLDREYLTPREAAGVSRSNNTDPFSHRFEERSPVNWRVRANGVESGYVFSRVDEGTKAFNVDVVGDGEPRMLSFFVPVPGLRVDHHDVSFEDLYSADQLKEVDLAGLVRELEKMPCCVRDKKGRDKGDPLNLAFVGEARHLYYAFMRAGWDETETIYFTSVIKTIWSALFSDSYRYSPVSALYVFGRAQDAALQRARGSIHERNHLRLWLTPLRFQGKPVWIGQISRDIGVHFTSRTIITHKIDPDVDETREFLLEDLVYAQSVKGFGYVGGVGPASYDEPRGNLVGDPYFTDGRRLLIWVAEQPTPFDELEVHDLAPLHSGVISD